MCNFLFGYLKKIGEFIIFIFRSFFSTPALNFIEFLRQIVQIGYFSLPIVALTAFFTGAVLAIQSYVGFGTVSEEVIAKIIVVSITKEIGPVLLGVIVSGRIASTIAAELGSMKVSEEIDVLRSLSVNFYGHLILPRIFTGIVFFPLIAIVADVFGVLGGYFICVYKFHFSGEIYIQNSLDFLNNKDFLSGIVKSCVFGFFATAVSCYNGINCTGGAKGVGFAVTNSVVISFVLILLFNYLITVAMFYE